MKRGHLDDAREEIVNERVERLIHEEFPRQARDRLEPAMHGYMNEERALLTLYRV